jgi:hypothetical protein
VFTLNAKGENKFEKLCLDAMSDMTVEVKLSGKSEYSNDKAVFQWVDKNFVYKPLKRFLKKEWLSKLRTNKEFTPDDLYIEKDKYLNNCLDKVY